MKRQQKTKAKALKAVQYITAKEVTGLQDAALQTSTSVL